MESITRCQPGRISARSSEHSHLAGLEGAQVQAAEDAARRNGPALRRPQRDGCAQFT